MYLLKRSLIIKRTIVPILFIALMAGCSNSNKQPDKAAESNPNNNIENRTEGINKPSDTNDSVSDTKTLTSNTTNTSQNTYPAKEDSVKILLLDIMKLAKEGKVINCDFPAKTTTIEDIEKKWGKAEKLDWVPTAKGNYATYSKHNAVFGFNKGSQIFEVRSFDSKIKKVPLSKVKAVLGKPDYDVKTNDEEIIGYVASKDFKILLVFPEPTKENSNPLLDHYSVFYPRGTVNLMADDPGREW